MSPVKFIRGWFNVGYFRPVAQYNKGKKAEFNDRRPTPVSKIKEQLR